MFLHLLYILSISTTSISNSLGNIFYCGCDAVGKCICHRTLFPIPAVVFTCYGHCHHLSVECLALAPTGKSYPPLRQEMQEAFRPEHMRQEAECARVDFPCPSPEQDLRKGKMMTMTYTPSTARFLHCSTGAASATSLLPLLFQKVTAFYRKSREKPFTLSF